MFDSGKGGKKNNKRKSCNVNKAKKKKHSSEIYAGQQEQRIIITKVCFEQPLI